MRASPLSLLGLALVTALAGCRRPVPSPDEVTASRAGAFADALARARTRFGGAEITADTVMISGRDGAAADPDAAPAPVRLDARIAGQGAGDTLYRLPDGRLALTAPTCASGGSCGCDVAIDYRYLRRDDGRVAVVRLTPQLEVIEHKVDFCGYGCGVPTPPAPVIAAAVPVTDPAQLEIVDEPYHYVQVVETCDHPVPRP